LKSLCRFCADLKLPDRTLSKRRIAVQIMCVEDAAHVAQAVPGDGGDFRLGAADESKTRDSSSPQIVERHASDASLRAGFTP
jgi:hypothetical protein